MILSQVQDLAKSIAERDLPQGLFLEAARFAIDEIEQFDERFIVREKATQAVDGNSLYTLPVSPPVDIFASQIHRVFFSPGDTKPYPLLQVRDMQAPVGNDPPTSVQYYDFPDNTSILLNGNPESGELWYYYRPYDTLAMDTDVLYPALTMGILVWFASNMWEDARVKSWEKTYKRQLTGMLTKIVTRDGNLGNIGDWHGNR